MYDKSGILILNKMVASVKKKSMNPDIKEIDEIFLRNYKEKNESFDDILEKLCILTHILSREFQLFLDNGDT
jgi:hypothetical protein